MCVRACVYAHKSHFISDESNVNWQIGTTFALEHCFDNGNVMLVVQVTVSWDAELLLGGCSVNAACPLY